MCHMPYSTILEFRKDENKGFTRAILTLAHGARFDRLTCRMFSNNWSKDGFGRRRSLESSGT